MLQEIALVLLLVLIKESPHDILHDFLKFTSTLAALSVLYSLLRSIPLFVNRGSLASVRADSMLSVLQAAGKLSKRARSIGDAAAPNARP
jgi:hypothetical protein